MSHRPAASAIRRHGAWSFVAVLGLTFVLFRSGFDVEYVIPKRLLRLAAMLIGGVCIAWSSITFQTITGNRMLTPAIMGYESVHLLTQSLLMLVLGPDALAGIGADAGFVLSVLVMLGYSRAIHHQLSRDGAHDVHVVLLLGMVLTIVIGTVTQFIQLRASPGEFSILAGFAQASFDVADPVRLSIAALVVTVVCAAASRTLPTLDVLLLGREQAMSLGVDYRRAVRRQMGLIAVLVALSTGLLGPTAFMGVFVANTALAVTHDYRHRATLAAGCAIAAGMFIAAQFAVEHLFNYRTTVGILINLVCGTWFLVLIVRARIVR